MSKDTMRKPEWRSWRGAVHVGREVRSTMADRCVQYVREGADRAAIRTGDCCILAERGEFGEIEVFDLTVERYKIIFPPTGPGDEDD